MAVYSCVSTLVLSSNPQVTVASDNYLNSYIALLFSPMVVFSHSLPKFSPFRTVMQILSQVPELVNLFAQVVASPVETSEVKALVGRAFSHLISLYGHQMQPLLSNLPPAHANALSAFAPRS